MVLRYDPAQFQGVSRDVFRQALTAEGVPAGKAYAMPLYKQRAFTRANLEPFYARRTALPDYEAMHLPAAERVCFEEQITIPHPVLLADREGLQSIVDAVAKLKQNAARLAHEPSYA
jgi:hypothetical protein